MKIKIIAAVSIDGAIGNGDELLWNVPEDLKHYKELTTGQKLIMGFNTFRTLPSVAKENRTHFVLKQQEDPDDYQFIDGGVLSTNKFQFLYRDANKLLKELRSNKNYKDDNIYVVGGSQVYNTLIDKCDEAIITWINKLYPEADKRFPMDKLFNDFMIFYDSDWRKSVSGIKYKITNYKRF